VARLAAAPGIEGLTPPSRGAADHEYPDCAAHEEGYEMTGYFGPIEKLSEKNRYFRRVLFTGKHSQLVLMCLAPGEEIGEEVHRTVDQFFRVEKGHARVVLNKTEKHLVNPGGAFVVPAGTRHNVINYSKTESLHLYTIYTPPQHPDGTIHKTKAEAVAGEHH